MYNDLLLPVDLNTEASWEKALPTALALADKFGAQLHIMTVVPDFGMAIVGTFFPEDFEQKAIAQANEALHAWVDEHVPAGREVQHVVAHGRVYEEVLRVAREIDADLDRLEAGVVPRSTLLANLGEDPFAALALTPQSSLPTSCLCPRRSERIFGSSPAKARACLRSPMQPVSPPSSPSGAYRCRPTRIQ